MDRLNYYFFMYMFIEFICFYALLSSFKKNNVLYHYLSIKYIIPLIISFAYRNSQRWIKGTFNKNKNVIKLSKYFVKYLKLLNSVVLH